jgi:hypothetical protein
MGRDLTDAIAVIGGAGFILEAPIRSEPQEHNRFR